MRISELSIKQLPPQEQAIIKKIIELDSKNQTKEALELAKSLRIEAQMLLPDSIMFKFDQLSEMSGTGGGASFNAGTGEQYATPKAFKKKKSMKLKEILKEIDGDKNKRK